MLPAPEKVTVVDGVLPEESSVPPLAPTVNRRLVLGRAAGVLQRAAVQDQVAGEPAEFGKPEPLPMLLGLATLPRAATFTVPPLMVVVPV